MFDVTKVPCIDQLTAKLNYRNLQTAVEIMFAKMSFGINFNLTQDNYFTVNI